MSSGKAQVTRNAILDAARALFEVDGYHSVGMEAVARKAGVSRQAVYLHFASKADLVQALHVRINELDVAPVMAKVWAKRSARSALDAFVGASADAIPRIIGIADALAPPARTDPDLEATWEAPREGRYADCWRIGEWLERDGALAPGVSVRDAADLLWMMVSMPSYASLVLQRGWKPERWIRWVRAVLHRELLAS